MLSSGISSRLRQLQHRSGSDDLTRNDLPQSCTEQPSSVGYSRQTVQPRAPARRGLAADLINKFNQMAAAPKPEQTATLSRSASRMNSSTNGIHKIFTSTTAELSPCLEARVYEQQPSPAASIVSASPVGGCSTNDTGDDEGIVTTKSTVTSSSATVPPSALSEVIVAEATSPHLISPVHPRVESLAEPCTSEARPSPFLSDSELNRALFEIQEFSRDMKILLDGGF